MVYQWDKNLPPKVQSIVKDINNKCYLSIASIWEIAIKVKLNKLGLKSDFSNISNFLIDNDIELLPITFNHIENLLNLELLHRDPFDRIIIAQAQIETLTIITKDSNFKNYSVQVIWE